MAKAYTRKISAEHVRVGLRMHAGIVDAAAPHVDLVRHGGAWHVTGRLGAEVLLDVPEYDDAHALALLALADCVARRRRRPAPEARCA